jgi:3'-phosphoadenosine 5'-phosphosulfate sulfotransferase (PAPS reductase)/FAD synthetase
MLPAVPAAMEMKKGTSSSIYLVPGNSARLRHPVPAVATTPEVEALLNKNAVVAIGVSGGKDSQACALAVNEHLNSIGHTGVRVLVHSDLGRVEWKDSINICEELASHLGLELLVVRRQAGDMMDRWLGRWKNNLARYADLSCVKLILPWSTPSMRFCTSELKVDVITAALKKRFPDQDILNVAGIRREESDARKKMPVSAQHAKLKRKGNIGITWNAIIEWKLDDVFAVIAQAGLRLHEAYTKYMASRVSCAYCIMSAEGDLRAAAGCLDNQALYIEMVELEASSTFAFQGHRWLADTAPDLLSPDLIKRIGEAKIKAQRRQSIESKIPEHLLYVKGWPTVMPTAEEAAVLAQVRKDVAGLLGLQLRYTTSQEVLARFAELFAEQAVKEAEKISKADRPKRRTKHIASSYEDATLAQ